MQYIIHFLRKLIPISLGLDSRHLIIFLETANRGVKMSMCLWNVKDSIAIDTSANTQSDNKIGNVHIITWRLWGGENKTFHAMLKYFQVTVSIFDKTLIYHHVSGNPKQFDNSNDNLPTYFRETGIATRNFRRLIFAVPKFADFSESLVECCIPHLFWCSMYMRTLRWGNWNIITINSKARIWLCQRMANQFDFLFGDLLQYLTENDRNVLRFASPFPFPAPDSLPPAPVVLDVSVSTVW